MASIISTVTTFADGFGRWRARVDFAHTLSESDPRDEFNLHRHWATIRARAREAIVGEVADREQKTGETRRDAERRVRAGLPRLAVVNQGLDSMNCWHGVTLGEP
jgi:hypothetical protein